MAATLTLRSRLRRPRPRVVDGVFAGALALIAIVELLFMDSSAPGFQPKGGFALLFALAETLPLVVRRERPDVTMTVSGGAGIAMLVWTVPSTFGGVFGIMVALYSIVAHGSRADAIVSGIVTATIPFSVMAVTLRGAVGFSDFVANYVLFGTAWALGYAARNRRLLVEELRQRADDAERSRADEARRAVVEERNRIARELHDVVAHTVSVMVVQAGAARRLQDRDPTAATEAMTAVERTGRSALQELRRLLGVLRTETRDDPAARDALAPQPQLRAVPALAETLRDAGIPVTVAVEGPLDDLPGGIDVSAYRIVQEALTNVLKHAGPARRVDVCIRRRAEVVEVEVTDDGYGAAAARHDGQGLVGMRERVAVYGGEFRAGPRPGGGFVVRATLPLPAADRAVVP